MQNYDELLLAIMRRAGSERRAAALFGIAPTSFNAWQRGRALPDDDQAAKIAQILDLDPAYTLAVVHLERARKKECERGVTDAWRRIVDMLGKAAALAFFAIGITTPQPADAALHNQNFGPDATVIHIARYLRRLLAAMLGALAFSVTASAHADTTDAALLGGALAALAVDWGQTRAIAQQPMRYEERNPILGQHPSIGRVNSYFALAMIGTAGLALALPREHSRIFLGGLILLETAVVVSNHGIGIRARF